MALAGTYNYLNTKNKSTAEPLLLRAKYSGGANLKYSPSIAWNVSAGLRFVGERYDSDFVFDENFLISYGFFPSYKTVRIAASYEVSEHFRVKLRLENLLDEEYTEAADFPAPGRTFYGSMQFHF